MKEYIVSVQDDERDFEELFIAHIRKQTELIRCKDCKHFSAFKKLPGYVCLNGYGLVNATPEDFCSYAEPEESGGE